MALPRRRINTPPGVPAVRLQQHTARFPVEQPDGSETFYEVTVEYGGQSWWDLVCIEPEIGNDALRRDLWERAAGEAQDRMFPGVES